MAVFAAVGMACLPGAATAQSPPTDVLLLLDTSGSMDGALDSAVTEVGGITDRLSAELGDVAFGVAEVRDYPIAAFDNSASGDVPYSVAQPITTDRAAVSSALAGLFPTGGGDGPEAYGRALRDAELGTGLGWRAGARRMAILVADNVPHDTDLNDGIPPELHAQPSPFDTLADPGPDVAFGTADDIDWQPLLDQLAANGMPLMLVLFEGSSQYLPYWEIWAGRTGGAAAMGGSDNLADVVVDLARRGATAKLPPCPPGQSRDSGRRCRPYTDWLGYSFQNASLPDWAGAAGLSSEDVLSTQLLERTFRDIDLPSWWEFWADDPRAELWSDMTRGVCFGMALSGGRFSTGLEPMSSAPDLRTAGSWMTPSVPRLPGPDHGADPTYQRELLQTLATDHGSQNSMEVLASIHDQRLSFAQQAHAGGGAAALRGQLEAIMSTGRGQVDSKELGSEGPVGIAVAGLIAPVGQTGHAVVAFGIRDQPDGGFHIDVWDNNGPGEVNWIPVAPDGSWSYAPSGLSGGAQDLVFFPTYRARSLSYQSGGKSASGRNVTVADIPAGATRLRASGRTAGGAATGVSVQSRFAATDRRVGRTVVTDGARLALTFKDGDAGATARGNGTILVADGLTSRRGAKASIAYDTSDGEVRARAPRTGSLAATRGDRSVTSRGATGLALSASGTVTASARRARTVTLVLSSTAGRTRSATVAIRVPRRGSVRIRGKQAAKALRGGRLRATVRRGKRRRAVTVRARSVARDYALRARIRKRGRRVALRLMTARRLPPRTRARVVWRVTRGKRTLLRRTVRVRRASRGRPIAAVRLPKGARRAKVRAKVWVAVNRPGPAELVAVARRRAR